MKTEHIDLPSNKKFGYLFTCVFSIIAIYCNQIGFTKLTFAFAFVSVAFLTVSLKRPNLLLPLNKAWMSLGLLLGKVISPIVLGLIFFGLFTPLAIGMRLLGRDELRLRTKEKNTYWASRDDEIQPDSFTRQF